MSELCAQLGLVGVDDLAAEKLQLARIYTDRRCPHIGEARPQCAVLGCPLHMGHSLRNGDRAKSDDEIANEVVALPYLCLMEAVRENPDGMTEEAIGTALRLSRQSVQDLLRRGLSAPAWHWDELVDRIASQHDPDHERDRPDMDRREVREAVATAILERVGDDYRTEQALRRQGLGWDREARCWSDLSRDPTT